MPPKQGLDDRFQDANRSTASESKSLMNRPMLVFALNPQVWKLLQQDTIDATERIQQTQPVAIRNSRAVSQCPVGICGRGHFVIQESDQNGCNSESFKTSERITFVSNIDLGSTVSYRKHSFQLSIMRYRRVSAVFLSKSEAESCKFSFRFSSMMSDNSANNEASWRS
jgi:hypothetical protein